MRMKHFMVVVVTGAMLLMMSCGNKTPQAIPKAIEQPVPEAPSLLLTPVPDRVVADNVYLESENVGGITQTKLLERINLIAESIDKEPVNAKIDPNKWVLTQSSAPGNKVNREATLQDVLNANPGDRIKLRTEEIKPELITETAKANITQISSFTTRLLDKDEGRLKNIKLASAKINYKKLGPGEIFSFNNTVGVRSEAKGYEEAPVIIKTEEGPKKGTGVGGGICQLSTTIFNAAEKSEMEIVERHEHSKKIGYVSKGQDATVSYGAVDLKFKNTRSYPIMVRVYMNDNSLTVKIFENKNP